MARVLSYILRKECLRQALFCGHLLTQMFTSWCFAAVIEQVDTLCGPTLGLGPSN